jgi:hypothetical protein
MVDSEDNKQMKFIEILLVVGGIIGGLGYKSGDSSVRFMLTLFLMSSLMYYHEVSNQRPGKQLYAMLTSSLFSGLITYPLMSNTPALSLWGPSYPKFNAITNYIMAIFLFYIIFKNLQKNSGESGKIIKSQNLIFIILGVFLTWTVLTWLTTSS